ncbi:MAG: AAA family ATPase [Atopobiaceae bacterium]|nr:AAA family ATPase [Atopobiaceae bacterium]
MARMIPASGPREFYAASKEGDLYDSLSRLSDDYIVVHSFSVISTQGRRFKEREGDFVVFHKDLGLLCIEAKAGVPSYRDGDWYYRNGTLMPHGGPFKQAESFGYSLRDAMVERGLSELLDRCKFTHGVWFCSLSRHAFDHVSLPLESSTRLMLFADDLVNPEPAIRRIFSLFKPEKRTRLSNAEVEQILDKVICPTFAIVPTGRDAVAVARAHFASLLDSQKRILDFMEDQRTAVISGSAGTGKTLIAIEKARRLSERGERVLFLCYNRMLMESVRLRCKDYAGVDTYTVAALACKLCGSSEPVYDELVFRLMEYEERGDFPYGHIVVDEGQDFGVDALAEASVLDQLKQMATDSENGSFYLFYDKNQLIQGSKVPQIIEDADCKMTLYINCRNTTNIAKSAARSLGDGYKQVAKTLGDPGITPSIVVTTNRAMQIQFVNDCISRFHALGAKSIVILTCKAERSSVFARNCHEAKGNLYWPGTKVPLFSCRRFKGLEADGIILVDVQSDVWNSQGRYAAGPGLLYYTGASRARLCLGIVCDMDDDDVLQVLEKLGISTKRSPKKRLAHELNAVMV